MIPVQTLKANLLDLMEKADPEGGLSTDDFARLDELVTLVSAQTPYPEPIRTPRCVEGRWETVFAHFGGRRSAGKPRVHMSDLRAQTFNRFPAVPVRVVRICQEVVREGAVYNNVVTVETPDGATRAQLIVRGRYAEDPDGDPRRFDIEFYQTEIQTPAGMSEEALRLAFGLESNAPLLHSLKAAKLFSDVVYVDEELRINRGGLGGLYVLRRLREPGVSVAFDPAP